MNDELLPYYSRELAFLREMGAGFAQEHPKIARRLAWTGGEAQDPHVERLIESVAFLNARIRHKLDDDFPEICGALLDVLYPHFQAPIPAMAIAKVALDASQANLATGYTLAPGADLETDGDDESRCRFRTAYPVTAWPFKIDAAALAPRPFTGPDSPLADRAAAVLRIELSALLPSIPLATFSCKSLRFYLHGAAAQQNVHALYELIFNNTLEIVIEGGGADKPKVRLAPNRIQPVGFEPDEGLLKYPARSFPGYRLLSEYFAFPEKFLFFDLEGLDFQRWTGPGNHKATIYFLLDRSSPELERTVAKSTFHLGCTPMVNLFPQTVEPFRLTQLTSEYRLVPDARRVRGTEIYSVDEVTATLPDGKRVEFKPFFGVKHAVADEEQRAFWYSSRRPSAASGGEWTDRGTEMFLTFVNLDPRLALRDDLTIDVQATILNRDLPHHLPFGGGQPRLSLLSAPNTVLRVECLTRPTRTRRPPAERGRLWRLISHLSLNHLSLADGAEGLDALREILTLYNFSGEQDATDRIAGIVGLASKPVVDRSPGVRGGFRRGTELKLSFDETKYVASGCYVLACVLDRFFGLYCTMNSFSRLVAVTRQREPKGEIWRWPSRAGNRALI